MRPPKISDWKFVYEACQDWPLTNRGPVTEQKAVDWVRRWIHREDEKCLVLVDVDEPVGYITWRQGMFTAVIDTIVVHPDHRRKGHANEMMRQLQSKLASEGVVVAEFDALPGPIADKIGRVFERRGEREGESGLTLTEGRVMADTQL